MPDPTPAPVPAPTPAPAASGLAYFATMVLVAVAVGAVVIYRQAAAPVSSAVADQLLVAIQYYSGETSSQISGLGDRLGKLEAEVLPAPDSPPQPSIDPAVATALAAVGTRLDKDEARIAALEAPSPAPLPVPAPPPVPPPVPQASAVSCAIVVTPGGAVDPSVSTAFATAGAKLTVRSPLQSDDFSGGYRPPCAFWTRGGQVVLKQQLAGDAADASYLILVLQGLSSAPAATP